MKNPEKIEKIYLSLDLDFWNCTERINGMMNFLYKIKNLNVPIKVVSEHHHLLPDINSVDCNGVVNIDYHSDIANNYKTEKICELNCGTWANRVKIRKQKDSFFKWIHPNSDDFSFTRAYCHVPQVESYSPFKKPGIAGWKNCIKSNILDVNLKNVAAVGIAFSYDWLEKNIIKKIVIARNILELKEIPEGWQKERAVKMGWEKYIHTGMIPLDIELD